MNTFAVASTVLLVGLLVVGSCFMQDDETSKVLIRLPMKRPFCNRYGGCSAAARLGLRTRDGSGSKQYGFQQVYVAPSPPVVDDSMAALKLAPPDLDNINVYYFRAPIRQRLWDILRTG